jgi:hypothetical protein
MAVKPVYNASGTLVAELDSSLSIVLPATINKGDIIIVLSHHRGASSVVLNTPTHATLTFAAIDIQHGGAISQQRCFWARAAGGEGGTTVTVTKASGTLQFQAAAHTFGLCKTTGNPYDETAGAMARATGGGASVAVSALTIADFANSLGVISYLEADDDVVVGNPTNTADATYTKLNDQASGVGLDARSVLFQATYTDNAPLATTATQPAADEYSLQQFVLVGEPDPVYDQIAFRARNDDGSESAATWKAAQNVDWEQGTDVNFRIRIEVQLSSVGAANDVNDWTFQWQYRHNAGTWTNITAAGGVPCSFVESSHVVDDTATTDQLTAGTGTFKAGKFREGEGTSASGFIERGGHTEHEMCFMLYGADTVPGDTFEFRLVRQLGGTVFDTYTDIPQCTIPSEGPIETVDAATALLAFTPSAVENAQLVEAATVPITLAPSAIEERQQYDSAVVQLALAPSALEERQQYDADTAQLLFTPSAADTAQFADNGTGLVVLSPSATEERQQYDAEITLLTLRPSSLDIAQYVDSDGAYFDLTPSGVDEQSGTTIDTGESYLDLQPAGIDAAQLVDADTLQLAFTPSAAEERQQYDTATGILALVASGTETAAYVDSDISRLFFSPSGVDERQQYDAATQYLTLTPSAQDIAEFVDVATVPVGLLPTGTDLAQYVDSTTGLLFFTPSGADIYEPAAGSDIGTIYLRFTPLTFIEVFFPFDTLLVGELKRRWSGTAQQRWGTGLYAGMNKWSVLLLNRKWSGSLFGSRWIADIERRWASVFLGRGKD